jgi:tol-pal system protein YbgF
MTRLLVLSSLLLAGVVMGCAGEGELEVLRAKMMILEREYSQTDREFATQLERIEARVMQPERDKAALRERWAQTSAILEALRVEVEHIDQRSPGLQEQMEATFAELGARLAAIEAYTRAKKSPDVAVAKAAQVTPKQVAPADPRPARQPEPLPPAPPELTSDPPTPATLPEDSSVTDLYTEAVRTYQVGDYEKSLELLHQFLHQYPQSPQAGSVHYWIGEVLYAQQKYEAAIVAFYDVVNKYPNNVKAPTAMLKQGLAFAALQDVRNARFVLQQVQQKYADSPEADQATVKLEQLTP